MKTLRRLRPLFLDNSRIPVWLSYLSPISIGAITLGAVVFSRGETSETTRRHETIHFQQYIDLLFVGFILLYLWDFLVGYLRYRNGQLAYRHIRAEREAYENEDDPEYLLQRKRWSWLRE